MNQVLPQSKLDRVLTLTTHSGGSVYPPRYREARYSGPRGRAGHRLPYRRRRECTSCIIVPFLVLIRRITSNPSQLSDPLPPHCFKGASQAIRQGYCTLFKRRQAKRGTLRFARGYANSLTILKCAGWYNSLHLCAFTSSMATCVHSHSTTQTHREKSPCHDYAAQLSGRRDHRG